MRCVFEDDFESGMDRWRLYDPKTWRVTEHDGNHAAEITSRESEYAASVRSPFHVAIIKDLEVGDAVIDFRVRSTLDTGNHRDCCVFLGHQDPTHFYYAHLGARPDPNSGQIMIVDGAPRRPLTENERLVPWDDKWHNVRVERRVKEGTIRVFFDDMDKPLMEATDTTFGAGGIGIGSFDDRDEFDDVRVYVPE
ncbi:hypothetical protein [Pirellulimonas nuda]